MAGVPLTAAEVAILKVMEVQELSAQHGVRAMPRWP